MDSGLWCGGSPAMGSMSCDVDTLEGRIVVSWSFWKTGLFTASLGTRAARCDDVEDKCDAYCMGQLGFG